jgi:hypothetical protein
MTLGALLGLVVLGRMPPRSPTASRYVVEIRDAAGESLLLTSADWTAKERIRAMSAILKAGRGRPG